MLGRWKNLTEVLRDLRFLPHDTVPFAFSKLDTKISLKQFHSLVLAFAFPLKFDHAMNSLPRCPFEKCHIAYDLLHRYIQGHSPHKYLMHEPTLWVYRRIPVHHLEVHGQEPNLTKSICWGPLAALMITYLKSPHHIQSMRGGMLSDRATTYAVDESGVEIWRKQKCLG